MALQGGTRELSNSEVCSLSHHWVNAGKDVGVQGLYEMSFNYTSHLADKAVHYTGRINSSPKRCWSQICHAGLSSTHLCWWEACGRIWCFITLASDWGSPQQEKSLLFVSPKDTILSIHRKRSRKIVSMYTPVITHSLFNTTSLVRILSIGAALGAQKERDVLWC